MNEIVYTDSMHYFERVSPGEGESNDLLYIFSNQKGRRYAWAKEGFIDFIKQLQNLIGPETIKKYKIIYVRVKDAQDLSSTGMWYYTEGGKTFKVYDDPNSLDWYDLTTKFGNRVRSIKKIDCEIVAQEESKNDPVNRPSHYTSGKIEVIDFIADQQLGFCLGNTVKYIARAGKKDKAKHLEDLKKAAWYLNREIEDYETRH